MPLRGTVLRWMISVGQGEFGRRSALRVEVRGGVLVVCPSGELDQATASDLDVLLKLATAGEPRDLIVDLADVTLIDEFTLAVLARVRQRLVEAQRAMVVRHACDQLRGVLDSAGLSEALEPDTARIDTTR